MARTSTGYGGRGGSTWFGTLTCVLTRVRPERQFQGRGNPTPDWFSGSRHQVKTGALPRPPPRAYGRGPTTTERQRRRGRRNFSWFPKPRSDRVTGFLENESTRDGMFTPRPSPRGSPRRLAREESWSPSSPAPALGALAASAATPGRARPGSARRA